VDGCSPSPKKSLSPASSIEPFKKSVFIVALSDQRLNVTFAIEEHLVHAYLSRSHPIGVSSPITIYGQSMPRLESWANCTLQGVEDEQLTMPFCIPSVRFSFSIIFVRDYSERDASKPASIHVDA
jgi:hypothetical protein